jgi:RHS repeat-associated protein
VAIAGRRGIRRKRGSGTIGRGGQKEPLRPVNAGGPQSNPPRRRPPFRIYAYTAREWDPEINLYYYRARYYDPKVGRSISEDPIGFEGGVNFYAYVGGNPTNVMDPSGRFAWGGGAGLTGGFTLIPLSPIAPALVGIFDVDCYIVGDLQGNTGILCCGGIGLGVGGGVD